MHPGIAGGIVDIWLNWDNVQKGGVYADWHVLLEESFVLKIKVSTDVPSLVEP